MKRMEPDRRWFLGTTVALAAGCSRTRKAEQDYAKWLANRQEMLAVMTKVDAKALRTTPPAPVDILSTHPELKTLTKIAMRLHPRYGDEPGPAESKIGGQFLWPKRDRWPTVTNRVEEPMVPVLQLRIEDAPPQCAFPPGKNLLQLFWAMSADLRPVIAWTATGDVTDVAEPPKVFGDNVPIPCRLFPERIAERPSLALMPAMEREKLKDVPEYDTMLSAAPGTKIGGYPRSTTPDDHPTCATCKRGMDYLLTIDPIEWNVPRWKPVEETDDSARSPLGIRFNALPGMSQVLIFICRRCAHWPIAHRLTNVP